MDSANQSNPHTTASAVSLSVKTLLRHVQDFGPCIISDTRLTKDYLPRLEVVLQANRRRRARCSCCGEPAPRYDEQPQRRWQYIALWNFMVFILYSPWRVNCAQCGVKIEALPWGAGKSPYARPLMHFLARWARRLSWKETAQIFGVSWDCVCRSVQWLVEWGLAHRDLGGVTALGIDELHWGKGKKSANFVTMIYQIDAGCRRLLWVGQRRAEVTLRAGLRTLEAGCAGFCAGITVVCSDMWKPYLKVVRTMLSTALNILDPFHIAQHLHRALDDVRRGEQSRMNAAARARIKGARFGLLKRYTRVRGRARERLHDALIALRETSQAWVFKEAFRRFWRYRCPRWAGAWLRGWVETVKASGLKPMVKVATMLANHHELLLNYFRAKRKYNNAVTEGLNHKARVSLAKAYGHRSFDVLQTALYHSLADLPEPPLAHRFC